MMPDDSTGDHKAADQETQELPTMGQNRRNLLKAAVIGSAAVAATAGAGAAAAALTGRQELSPLNQIAWIIKGSPGDPCSVCTTNTNKDKFATQDTFHGESMMLWLRFLNVPAGTYTVDVSPTIQASTATSCPTSAPFRYQSPHNAVKLWVLDARNYDCHPLTLNELDTFPQTNADALPATFPITTSKHCLLAQVHLDLCASGSHTYTVTASLKQGGTVIQSCTHQITIA